MTAQKKNHIHRGIQHGHFASINWEPSQQATGVMSFSFYKRNSNICMIKITNGIQKCDCDVTIMNKCWDKKNLLRVPLRKTVFKIQMQCNLWDSADIHDHKLSWLNRIIFQHLIKAPLFMLNCKYPPTFTINTCPKIPQHQIYMS